MAFGWRVHGDLIVGGTVPGYPGTSASFVGAVAAIRAADGGRGLTGAP